MALAVLFVATAAAALVWLVLEGAEPSPAASDEALAERRTGAPAKGRSVDAARRRVNVAIDAPVAERWLVPPEPGDSGPAADVHRAFGPDQDDEARAAALERLKTLSPDDLVPALLRVAGVGEPGWRNTEALLLIAHFGPDARPWLDDLEGFVDDGFSVGLAAMRVMASTGDAGVGPLVRATELPDPRLRVAALRTLREAKATDPRIIAAAIARLEDRDGDVRRRALDVLGARHDDADRSVAALTTMLNDSAVDRVRVIDAIGDLGDAASPLAPRLVEIATSGEPREQAAALAALGRMPTGGVGSAPAILRLIESDPVRHARHAESVARISKSDFVAGAESPNTATRAAFVRATPSHLQAFPHARSSAIATLVTALRDEESAVRAAAVGASSKVGGDRSALLQSIEDVAKNSAEVPGTRRRAVLVLITAGASDRANRALAALLEDSSPSDRQRLLRALEGLRERASSVIPTLRRLLSDENAWVVAGALRALAAIGSESAVALPDVRALLNSGSDVKRLEAAITLLALDSPALDVTVALRSFRGTAREPELVNGLSRYPHARFAPLLIEIMESEATNWFSAQRALVRLGGSAVPFVEDRLDVTTESVPRSRLVLTLTQIGVDARPALQRILERDDLQQDLRTTIVVGLERMK